MLGITMDLSELAFAIKLWFTIILATHRDAKHALGVL
jgi:hypothetical protein